MPIPATQVKVGMTIIYNGQPHRVIQVVHVTPGNWRGMVQTKMVNIKTGSNAEHRFRSEDKVDRAEMETHEMRYLYQAGDDFVFMNTENYEQASMNREVLGDATLYLVENMDVTVDYFEGKPVGVELPLSVTLEIVECDPPLKGATASGSPKPAKLGTGLMVKVPQHMSVGDKVNVDTRDGSFIGRA
ncbi:MAG TPA: elongation factor P [Candidatus Saccharimonadales bacterium]|nr:elongation factor P [Candidatus Saccharimonadales bacterium]